MANSIHVHTVLLRMNMLVMFMQDTGSRVLVFIDVKQDGAVSRLTVS